MTRRRLLASIEPPGTPLPPDPTLTEPRFVTAPLSINQNVTTVTGDGRTWEHQAFKLLEDAASLRLVFHGASQGEITNPSTLKASLRKAGGSFVAVTFDGTASGTLVREAGLVSDPIAGPFAEGEMFDVRVYSPAQTINTYRAALTAPGEHLTETPMPGAGQFPSDGPTPLGIIGACRESAMSLGLLGDSIAAQGIWWRTALAAHGLPGVNMGRNVTQFGSGYWAQDSMPAITHLLVQFGVNDLGAAPSVATLWTKAVGCYASVRGYTPNELPIWQTTPTPIVDTTDDCATLAGQTVRSYAATARQPWIAFLRDGAPCDPDTLAAAGVGATGVVRAGQPGHPLSGVIDVAAAVEQGSSSTPTGKWRVDLGPLGGDGVHPSGLGESVMAGPVESWASTLTA